MVLVLQPLQGLVHGAALGLERRPQLQPGAGERQQGDRSVDAAQLVLELAQAPAGLAAELIPDPDPAGLGLVQSGGQGAAGHGEIQVGQGIDRSSDRVRVGALHHQSGQVFHRGADAHLIPHLALACAGGLAARLLEFRGPGGDTGPALDRGPQPGHHAQAGPVGGAGDGIAFVAAQFGRAHGVQSPWNLRQVLDPVGFCGPRRGEAHALRAEAPAR
jgi:hypothetical protein